MGWIQEVFGCLTTGLLLVRQLRNMCASLRALRLSPETVRHLNPCTPGQHFVQGYRGEELGLSVNPVLTAACVAIELCSAAVGGLLVRLDLRLAAAALHCSCLLAPSGCLTTCLVVSLPAALLCSRSVLFLAVQKWYGYSCLPASCCWAPAAAAASPCHTAC